MVTRVENINRDILKWAITRSGVSLKDFYSKNPKVEEWVKEKKDPTLKQLEDFTHKVHIPFGYLFLKEPPKEDIPIPFFRTGKRQAENISLNVYHTIQIIQDRQDWLTEYLKDLDFPDLDFVGKFNVNSSYLDIVNDIRNTLDLKIDWANSLENWNLTLNYLTSKIEEIGIIVTFNGIVGNSTNRIIDVEECRGFVLVDSKAPFLFVNAGDAKAAQVFTLIHELAHVWIGESAGFDNKNLLPADDPTELLCDLVAAEFLVPEIFLRKKWETSNDFKYLSRVFKVSPIVVARRALDLGLITRANFFSFYNVYIQDFKNKKEEKNGKGHFYLTARKRVSVKFASFVNNAVNENRLMYRDAYKLTNLKGDNYKRFINEYMY